MTDSPKQADELFMRIGVEDQTTVVGMKLHLQNTRFRTLKLRVLKRILVALAVGRFLGSVWLAVTMWNEFAGLECSPSLSAWLRAARINSGRYRRGRHGFLRC